MSTKMHTLSSILVVTMLVVSTGAQNDAARASSNGSSRHLQPWLIGLTAMVTFLFIVFVLMIANRLFCKKKKDEFNEENIKRERMEGNTYESRILDEDGENMIERNVVQLEEKDKEAQKVTQM